MSWEGKLVLFAKADKMLDMRTVQQNMFLILNSVPVTFFTDPELIRPIPVMMHPFDQKSMARKVKARMRTAEIVENFQAKIDKQHRLVTYFY
jgi:hypothetical protein